MNNIFTKSSLNDITIADIQFLIDNHVPEGQTLDYKRDITKDLPEDIAALANSDGGLLIIGIEETRGIPTRISGIPIARGSFKTDITSKCFSKIQPVYAPEIVEVPYAEDKIVIVLKIDPSSISTLPLVVDGRIYKRLNDRRIPADWTSISRMFEGQKSKADHQEDAFIYWKSSLNTNHHLGNGRMTCFINFALPNKYPTTEGIQYPNILLVTQFIEEFKSRGFYLWTQEWSPVGATSSVVNYLGFRDKAKRERKKLSQIQFERSNHLDWTFYPQLNGKPYNFNKSFQVGPVDMDYHLEFVINANGFLSGAIAIPNNNIIYGDFRQIFQAIKDMAALLLSDELIASLDTIIPIQGSVLFNIGFTNCPEKLKFHNLNVEHGGPDSNNIFNWESDIHQFSPKEMDFDMHIRRVLDKCFASKGYYNLEEEY